MIKVSLIPREMPGNLGNRKHLILIKTEGSGRKEQTILRTEGRQLCFVWGEERVLNYSLVKVVTENIIND